MKVLPTYKQENPTRLSQQRNYPPNRLRRIEKGRERDLVLTPIAHSLHTHTPELCKALFFLRTYCQVNSNCTCLRTCQTCSTWLTLGPADVCVGVCVAVCGGVLVSTYERERDYTYAGSNDKTWISLISFVIRSWKQALLKCLSSFCCVNLISPNCGQNNLIKKQCMLSNREYLILKNICIMGWNVSNLAP